ncbi:MAG: hypothetical protein ACRDH7_07915 [Actinomycetota bacterium]
MSAKAGTIQGTQTGASIGAWIAAIVLATVIAVGLLAVVASSRTSQPVPTTAKVENTVPVGMSHVGPKAGTTVPVGFSHVAPTAGARPWRPIVVNGSVCHQCL